MTGLVVEAKLGVMMRVDVRDVDAPSLMKEHHTNIIITMKPSESFVEELIREDITSKCHDASLDGLDETLTRTKVKHTVVGQLMSSSLRVPPREPMPLDIIATRYTDETNTALPKCCDEFFLTFRIDQLEIIM